MNDMSSTIVAKSDQINAADLVGISRTITVKEVRIKAGDDQPVTILVEGDTKAFRPCKGVRRLLVRVWGPDANKYIGQSLTLFCDPTVTWAGKPEGGIRVSHMTGLDEEIIEYMRTSREKTKPYKIEPLVLAQQVDKAAQWVADQVAAVAACNDAEALDALSTKGAKPMGKLQTDRPGLHAQVLAAYAEKRSQLDDDDDDPFAEPETPDPAAQTLTNIRESIAGCRKPGELETCARAWLKHRDAYDADVAAEVDAEIEAKRVALGEAQ